MYKSNIMLAAILWLTGNAVLAAETQNQNQNKEPIYIESDSLRIDDTRGVSTYSGNVVFRQGTDSLRADELVIYSEQRQELKRVVATGKPARFDHEDPIPAETSWGEANTIEYIADKSLLVLTGAARFQQGDNQFSGNRIEYDSEKKLVRAGKVGDTGGRVQIVIHPNNKAANDDSTVQPANGSSGE